MVLANAVRQRILYLTKLKKNNLKELSRVSNVSYSTLTSFMIGKTRILTLSTLYDLCAGLEITLFEFFDDPIFKDVVDEEDKELSNK